MPRCTRRRTERSRSRFTECTDPREERPVYVGSFASQKQVEAADEQHRVTQRAIKSGDLPAAVNHKRTLDDALDAWIKAIKDQRSARRVREPNAALYPADVRQHAAREAHEAQVHRPAYFAQAPVPLAQSAGEVQKLLSACDDNIRTLVAVLVGTGMRLDEALHLMWTDIDL